MKYRIKEEISRSGESIYYVQYDGIMGWSTCGNRMDGKTQFFKLKDAQDCIDDCNERQIVKTVYH